jgi:vancomycin resistance protein VanJ
LPIGALGVRVRPTIVTIPTQPTALPQRRTLTLARLSWLYATLLIIALAIRFGAGDRSPWLFAVNALLLYFFLPAPLVLLAGVVTGRRDLVLIFAAGAGVWAYLWGGLFLPRAPAGTTERTLTVLSYNLLGFNFDSSDTVHVIRDSGADLVALHELNPENAAAIERELGTLYPYRWLEPRAGVTGSGILSKYRFDRVDPQPLRGPEWIGEPMTIELAMGSRRVTMVGFHAAAGPDFVREREQQARDLAAYARSRSGPVLLAGDLNATDQNSAYAIVTTETRDAWREAGRGFGHTFPGPPTPATGGSRPVLLGIPVPLWLVRIDYVFHSDEFEAIDARTNVNQGSSDHRGVIATLVLR